MVKLNLKDGQVLDVKFTSFFKLYLLSLLTISGIGYLVGLILGVLLVIIGY